MKAILYTQFGSPDALELKETEKPIPSDHQLLIKVCAASVNALDRHLLKSEGLLMRAMIGNGFVKPKDQRIGADIAGRVEAVGDQVTHFQPGDEVFGTVSTGGFAEYVCADEGKVALKPASVSFEAAAAVPVAGLTALQSLRDKGMVEAGQKVLISGASGGVGTFAVQIAKALGAEVTAVCSTRNLEMARSIGADHVIDYTQEDVTRNGQRYDLILAVNGYHSIFAYRRILGPRGRYILVGEGSNAHLMRALIQSMLLGPILSRMGSQKWGFLGITNSNRMDLTLVGEMLEAGKVVPVIDKCYPLGETAKAMWYVERQHAMGKVVITVDNNTDIPL